MKSIPVVSVLMPAFNSAKYLPYAIDSILGQSFADFELVIVDDGSTDDTPSLLKDYARKDRRIVIVKNQNNCGIVQTLNLGFKSCSGRYIARMDADDIALTDRLKKQVTMLDRDQSILALGGALAYIDNSGNDLNIIRHCELGKSLLLKSPLLHPTVMMRSDCLLKNHLLYQEKYRYAEDYFLWLQLSRIGKIAAIKDVVLKYRIHDQATKVKRAKGTLWATLMVKRDGIFKLKIRPNLKDVSIMLLEFCLLFLPQSAILFLYFKIFLKKAFIHENTFSYPSGARQ